MMRDYRISVPAALLFNVTAQSEHGARLAALKYLKRRLDEFEGLTLTLEGQELRVYPEMDSDELGICDVGEPVAKARP